MSFMYITEADLEGHASPLSPSSPIFRNHLFFCDHFKELKTVFIEVKLIIINTPLTYVSPNTIKTYLTPNHLLFVTHKLLCYSNTTSAVIRNLIVLSSTTDTIYRINNHFWRRWRHKCVVNLHETQRASKLNINSQKLYCASLWLKGAQTLLEICLSNSRII